MSNNYPHSDYDNISPKVDDRKIGYRITATLAEYTSLSQEQTQRLVMRTGQLAVIVAAIIAIFQAAFSGNIWQISVLVPWLVIAVVWEYFSNDRKISRARIQKKRHGERLSKYTEESEFTWEDDPVRDTRRSWRKAQELLINWIRFTFPSIMALGYAYTYVEGLWWVGFVVGCFLVLWVVLICWENRDF